MKCTSCSDDAVYECGTCGKPLCAKHARFRTVCANCVNSERLVYGIRKMGSASEKETVRELVKRFWGEDQQLTFGRVFEVSKLPAYVAKVKNKVAGFVASASLGDAVIIVALGVAPEYQSCGIGGELVERVECEARRMGKRKLLVSTSNDDLPALAFYQCRGFQIFSVKTNVIAKKHGKILVGIGGLPIRDELRMRKIL